MEFIHFVNINKVNGITKLGTIKKVGKWYVQMDANRTRYI